MAEAAAVASRGYVPRSAEQSVLHEVVRDHLEAFLAEAAARSDGAGLPSFVVREFRDFLACGVLARGFARVRCRDCAFERLVPFSCKGRGFCPSCGGRRMTAQAAHLVDAVLPHVTVRQWVLTFPYRLRYLLAWDHRLCRAVLGVYIRALFAFHRRRARRAGVRGGQGGAVTVIQRFGGGVQLNVHLHTLLLEGVFYEGARGELRFLPLAAPTDEEVARLLAAVRTRVLHLLRRRGLDPNEPTDAPADPLAEESMTLAALATASIQGRVALGPRAGARVLRVGGDPDAPWVTSRGPRQAHFEGFDLHADVAVPAGDRGRLEQLCRYVLRPPLAQERLSRMPDGRVLVTLKSEWHDGTTHLLFAPVELLEKLAALTPRPRVHLVLYHGVLAPHARLRERAVSYGAPGGALEEPAAGAGAEPAPPVSSRRHWKWADLMRRAFEIDVLSCPRCGGRMELIATIDDPAVVRKILTHLGLPTEVPAARPARPPPTSGLL